MKRYLYLVCALILTLSAIGCIGKNNDASSTKNTVAGTTYDIESVLNTNGSFDCVEGEDGYYLVMPNNQSDLKINVHEECLDHLSKIDADLFYAAGNKILLDANESIDDMEGKPFLSISLDNENYLYMYGELIKKIDPPVTTVYDGEVISGGCGRDHEHFYFRERISLSPVE